MGFLPKEFYNLHELWKYCSIIIYVNNVRSSPQILPQCVPRTADKLGEGRHGWFSNCLLSFCCDISPPCTDCLSPDHILGCVECWAWECLSKYGVNSNHSKLTNISTAHHHTAPLFSYNLSTYCSPLSMHNARSMCIAKLNFNWTGLKLSLIPQYVEKKI